jgi:pimeloyl-ACP methyl ester carboxylesterase
MNKLLLILAFTLPCTSLLLAKRAVDELPLRVDVDGRQLRLRIEGAGSPTVVMEIGLGGPLEEWATVQPEVAKFTRVVAYDRIGSNHSSEVFTGRNVAAELHTALAKAQLPPPYVLVGQSFGGTFNRVFASMYPGEVVGMVLLDPSQESFIDWMEIHHPEKGLSKMRKEDPRMAATIAETLEELKSSGPLPDVPVVVVTGARPNSNSFWAELLPEWTASHDEFTRQLPNGRHVITEKSGHGVQVEQPELVVDLIREIVEAARRTANRPVANEQSAGGMP